MKTIGTIILLTIFLAGAYLLGNHRGTATLRKKIDSLQNSVNNQLVEIQRLKVSLDSSKKSTDTKRAKVFDSAVRKTKKK